MSNTSSRHTSMRKEMRGKEEILSVKGKELFYKKSSRIAAPYLRRLEMASDTPEEMKPFFEILRKVYVEMGAPYEKKDQVMVGTFCAMVPNELIYAAGAYPVRLCSGSFTAYSISDGLAARDACPLVKAVAGFACSGTMPLYDDCALMVIPVTCDCKKKIAGLLGQKKKTAVMQIPQGKHADGDGEVFRRELYRLIPQLEEVTGREITAKTLAEAVNRVGYAQYEMSRFLGFRRNIPPLISGAQAMAAMNAYAYMPADVWADAMHSLNGELEKRMAGQKFAAKGNRPRILLTGSPIAFPNMKLPLLIEEMGGNLVADETCLGDRAVYDPVSIVDVSFDGMVRALADRYIKPCTCPVFADNSQRIFRIRQMVKEYQIQGIVCHILRGCLVYDYEYPVLEEELEKMGIPVIRIESDYNEEDVEQLRIRMEAFIEMIKMQEYQKRR